MEDQLAAGRGRAQRLDSGRSADLRRRPQRGQNGPTPFSVANSILTITARPTAGLPSPFTYTSGCMSTAGLFSFQYGYAEIRCQAPGGKGFWPTFWMMKWTRKWEDVVWPPEIDIFQASSRINNQYYPAVLSGPKKKPIEAGQFVDTGVDISQGMHTYGFEWTQEKMAWYLRRQSR